jgi:hypothetical protein
MLPHAKLAKNVANFALQGPSICGKESSIATMVRFLQRWRPKLPHPFADQPDQTQTPLNWRGRRGEWPADPHISLPYFLSEDDLAHLLDKSVRTLQRRRRLGRSPPFTKNGKQVLYARDPALVYYGAPRSMSGQEEKTGAGAVVQLPERCVA